MSSPLGNGAIVETLDNKILVLRRSKNVGEFPGCFVFPGGHPEVLTECCFFCRSFFFIFSDISVSFLCVNSSCLLENVAFCVTFYASDNGFASIDSIFFFTQFTSDSE